MFSPADVILRSESCPLEESYNLHKFLFVVSLMCEAIDYEQHMGFSDGSKRATAGGHQNSKLPATVRDLNDTFL